MSQNLVKESHENLPWISELMTKIIFLYLGVTLGKIQFHICAKQEILTIFLFFFKLFHMFTLFTFFFPLESQLYIFSRCFFEGWSVYLKDQVIVLKLLKITLIKIIIFDTFDKTGKTDIWLYFSQSEYPLVIKS